MLRLLQVTFAIALALLVALAGGCQSYRVPGRAADMSLFGPGSDLSPQQIEQATDSRIRSLLNRKPLATFPVHLTVARVQAPGYRSYTTSGYGRGRYSIVTTRDVETDEAYARVANLPQIQGVAPLNRLLLPERLESDEELRLAAAQLRSNMLLIYTFDTHLHIGDTDSPLDVITLGFLPNKRAEVVTTASAVLMDTRNGYVYGTAEATARTAQQANTWTESQAVDQSRQRTEAQAFNQLVEAFAVTWQAVLDEYGPAAAMTPSNALTDTR